MARSPKGAKQAIPLPPPFEGEGNYIFISYKREDLHRITSSLHHIVGSGHNIWYDKGIPGGANWSSLIEQKVSGCDLLLVFISQAAVESKWLRREVSVADRQDKPILAVQLEEAKLKHGLGMLLEPSQIVSASDVDFSGELMRAINHHRQQEGPRSSQRERTDHLEHAQSEPVQAAAEKATEAIRGVWRFLWPKTKPPTVSESTDPGSDGHLVLPGRVNWLFLFLLLVPIHMLIAALTIDEFVPLVLPNFLEPALWGLALGMGQILVLRRLAPLTRGWILSTVAGGIAAGLVYGLLGFPWEMSWKFFEPYAKDLPFIKPAAPIMAFLALRWLLVSSFQWLSLRQFTRQAWVWPLATAGAAALWGLVVAMFSYGTSRNGLLLMNVLCPGFLIGGAQGLCLVYIRTKTSLMKS